MPGPVLVYLFAVRVGDVQTWGDGIVKIYIPVAGCRDQTLEMVRLLHSVEFPPVSSMFAIIFRSVDIAGHSPGVHLLEEIFPL